MSAHDRSYFSTICMERCGGVCCDPWWGIISWPLVREGGLRNPESLKAEVLKGIKARARRIMDAYVTAEERPRPLFGSPFRYNVLVRDIKAAGTAIQAELVAMFAFRCAFLSEGGSCSIHPALLGCEIRPPHCGALGDPSAAPGQKGFCRVLHAAGSEDAGQVEKGVAFERETSGRNLKEGVETPEEAAEKVIAALRSWCAGRAPHLLEEKRAAAPGRNDPCWCGSGQKFKKCHG